MLLNIGYTGNVLIMLLIVVRLCISQQRLLVNRFNLLIIALFFFRNCLQLRMNCYIIVSLLLDPGDGLVQAVPLLPSLL